MISMIPTIEYTMFVHSWCLKKPIFGQNRMWFLAFPISSWVNHTNNHQECLQHMHTLYHYVHRGKLWFLEYQIHHLRINRINKKTKEIKFSDKFESKKSTILPNSPSTGDADKNWQVNDSVVPFLVILTSKFGLLCKLSPFSSSSWSSLLAVTSNSSSWVDESTVWLTLNTTSMLYNHRNKINFKFIIHSLSV